MSYDQDIQESTDQSDYFVSMVQHDIQEPSTDQDYIVSMVQRSMITGVDIAPNTSTEVNNLEESNLIPNLSDNLDEIIQEIQVIIQDDSEVTPRGRRINNSQRSSTKKMNTEAKQTIDAFHEDSDLIDFAMKAKLGEGVIQFLKSVDNAGSRDWIKTLVDTVGLDIISDHDFCTWVAKQIGYTRPFHLHKRILIWTEPNFEETRGGSNRHSSTEINIIYNDWI